MPELILNPRRAPRAAVRCEARLALREGGFWSSPTRDYGPRGCQLLAPRPLTPGSRIFIELANERVEGCVQLAGRVAWTSFAPPWRLGVAFDAGSVAAAEGFYDRLAAAYPGIDTYARAPEGLPADAVLAPARPPELLPLLTPEEAEVLCAIGAGLRVAALRDRFAERLEAALNATFSLLARRCVVVGERDEGAAAQWARLLAVAS
jgi:hypothetical protein